MLSLVAARAPSLLLFTTLESGLVYFVYTQQTKPSLISGPIPTAIPKGYIGRARFGPHDFHPTHVAETLTLREAHHH